MRSMMLGYTLLEILMVVALVAVLVGVAATYKIADTELQLAELEFRRNYQKAKNISVHAHNLHIQGFRSTSDLNRLQLKTMTRGNDWQAAADQISAITAEHAEDDFKIRFNAQDIRIKFFVDDDVGLNGYPLQRRQIAGSKDEVILIETVRNKRSRILRLNDYLMN